MQVNKGVAVVNRLPELTLANKPKLIISKEIQSQITYLHHRVGKVEWSGELLYSIQEGSILELDNFVIKAEGIFPLDKGTYSHTEHETTVDIVDMFDMYPALMDDELKRGFCHTHQEFGTFFSGEDMRELHDNSEKHNYYLSLIVNFQCDYKAKIAIVAEQKKEVVINSNELIFKGDDAQPVSMSLVVPKVEESKPCLVLIDCIIEFEVNDDFKAKVDEICSKPAKVTYNTPVNKAGEKKFPLVHDSRKFDKSPSTKFADKYADDVTPFTEDWEEKLFKNWGNDTLDSSEPDRADVSLFLRDILSTEKTVLSSDILEKFPLGYGLAQISASLKDLGELDDYMNDVEINFEKYWDRYFDDKFYTLKLVSGVAGDIIDDIYPEPVKGTFGWELSNVMWAIYNRK